MGGEDDRVAAQHAHRRRDMAHRARGRVWGGVGVAAVDQAHVQLPVPHRLGGVFIQAQRGTHLGLCQVSDGFLVGEDRSRQRREHLLLGCGDGPPCQDVRGGAVRVVAAEDLHVVVVARQVGDCAAQRDHPSDLGCLAQSACIVRRRDLQWTSVRPALTGDPVGQSASRKDELGPPPAYPRPAGAGGLHRHPQPVGDVRVSVPDRACDREQAAQQPRYVPAPLPVERGPVTVVGRRATGVQAALDPPGAALGLCKTHPAVGELDVVHGEIEEFFRCALVHGQQQQHAKRLQIQLTREHHRRKTRQQRLRGPCGARVPGDLPDLGGPVSG